jgi:hypothetical protein
MGSFEQHAAAMPASRGRQIHAADVIALLREVYADGIGTREEAEELIAFDYSLSAPTPGWSEFFAASVADHVTRRQAPLGIVDGEKAAWLIRALSRGRQSLTTGGLAALLRVLDTAQDVAPALPAFAIRQMRSIVMTGRGPASSVRLNFKRAVDLESAAQVRRILLGPAEQLSRPVSREEAEALFDLHDLAAGGDNDADFDDLFFKAIAHHLIAHGGGDVPPRGEALARHSDFPNGVNAGPLAGDEIAWLSSQIMRDGRPTKTEFALLRYFAGDAGDAGDASATDGAESLQHMIRAA